MVETTLKTGVDARLFIGVPIPDHVVEALQPALNHYPQHIEHRTLRPNLHLTLAFLGDVENPRQYLSRLLKPLPQSFVPTVRLTHVGRGRARDQLWAYAEPSMNLLTIRQHLLDRLAKIRFQWPANATKRSRREYLPHITLAKLYDATRSVGLADYPMPLSFAIEAAVLYRSEQSPQGPIYHSEGTITLIE